MIKSKKLMNNIAYKKMQKLFSARAFRERVILLVAFSFIIFFVWLTFAFDVLQASQSNTERQIANELVQMNNEINRNQQISSTYTSDPNLFARRRRNELQVDINNIDEQLLNSYGELILPSQMANVLSDVLERDTTLRLIRLENFPPEIIFDSGAETNIQVYRHGLSLMLEGEYLETIRFLRQVESLGVNFFWENLSYQIGEHPDGTISLNIFTLSTQRGFIGV